MKPNVTAGRLEEALAQYKRSQDYGVERAAMHIRNVRLMPHICRRFLSWSRTFSGQRKDPGTKDARCGEWKKIRVIVDRESINRFCIGNCLCQTARVSDAKPDIGSYCIPWEFMTLLRIYSPEELCTGTWLQSIIYIHVFLTSWIRDRREIARGEIDPSPRPTIRFLSYPSKF